MSGKILLDPAALDTSAGKLRAIDSTLGTVKTRLHHRLTTGAPPALAGRIAEALAEARRSLDKVGSSSVRQAEELGRRAALARLADGQATEKDLSLLVSLISGKHAIDPNKRPDLARQIAAAIKPYQPVMAMLEQGTAGYSKYWKQQTLGHDPSPSVGVASAVGAAAVAAGVTTVRQALKNGGGVRRLAPDERSSPGATGVVDGIGGIGRGTQTVATAVKGVGGGGIVQGRPGHVPAGMITVSAGVGIGAAAGAAIGLIVKGA